MFSILLLISCSPIPRVVFIGCRVIYCLLFPRIRERYEFTRARKKDGENTGYLTTGWVRKGYFSSWIVSGGRVHQIVKSKGQPAGTNVQNSFCIFCQFFFETSFNMIIGNTCVSKPRFCNTIYLGYQNNIGVSLASSLTCINTHPSYWHTATIHCSHVPIWREKSPLISPVPTSLRV